MTADLDCAYVVPPTMRWDDEIIKSFEECAPYYFGGVAPRVDGRQIKLTGRPRDRFEGDPLEVLTRLVADLVRGYRDATEQPLQEHVSSRPFPESDPFQALIDARAVVPAGPGRFSYHGDFLGMMQGLDRLICDLAHGRNAVEEVYPATVPTDLLRRSGYLKSFPHHAFFVAPVRFEQRSLQVAEKGIGPSSGQRLAADGYLADAGDVLAPTVCYHSFNARKDRQGQATESVTAVNMCHRFESGKDRSLERLSTFRMREIVVFGNAEHVARELDYYFDWFLDLLRRWDVGFRATTANDPFFASSSDGKRLFQTAFALKREVRLRIPGDQRWISVASFNNHSNSLVNAFSIAGDENSALSSGCVGFGYERLLYGLYCAFGVDVATWPAAFRAR